MDDKQTIQQDGSPQLLSEHDLSLITEQMSVSECQQQHINSKLLVQDHSLDFVSRQELQVAISSPLMRVEMHDGHMDSHEQQQHQVLPEVQGTIYHTSEQEEMVCITHFFTLLEHVFE